MTATGVAGEPRAPEAGEARLIAAWSSPPGLLGFATAVNHKQIGVRFIVTAFLFLLVGGVQALLLRLQLAGPDGELLSAEAYNQAFTMHGTTMMFLFAVPMLEGLAMYLVPLMIGARDLPFPRLNAFGYWAYLFGGLIVYASFATGDIPDGGWFAYTPLTGPEYSPGRNLDFWLLGVTLVEVSGIVGGLEIVVAALKHRARGMSLMRMPLFVWSALVMGVMVLFAFPAVVVGSVLLEIERKTGAPFYSPTGGGEPLLWQHLFWIFGHPEVYIMLIPATGIVSTIVPVFSRRSIVAYPLIVASLVAIAVASFGLWAHHMFTVGLSTLVVALFALASFLIAIPSGVQVFAWLATLLRGRPRWSVPLLYCAGFLLLFVAGGITGVMVASAPFDAQAHDSFFVVAHFHYVLIGGVVFPIFGGLHYWWPKITGRLPNEGLGKAAFWLMFAGFNLAFFVQHLLGLDGMPRRVYRYDSASGWGDYNLVSTVGAFVLAAGILLFGWNLAHSAFRGRRSGPDPWNADTLEWLADSPPAPYNFREMPAVHHREPLWQEGGVGSIGLAEPPGLVREQPATSPVDAADTGTTLLPGPSAWPLAAAATLAASLVALLVDQTPAFLALLVATGATTLAWLAPRQAPTVRGDDDGPVSGRPGWWGGLAAVAVAWALLGMLLYSYLYLYVSNDPWIPTFASAPGLLLPAGSVAAMVVAGTAAWFGYRKPTSRAPTVLAGGAGGAGFALLLAEILRAGMKIDRSSFEAATVVLDAAVLALAGAAVLVSLVVRYHHVRPTSPAWMAAARALHAIAWAVAASAAASVFAVVHVWPNVS